MRIQWYPTQRHHSPPPQKKKYMALLGGIIEEKTDEKKPFKNALAPYFLGFPGVNPPERRQDTS